MTDRLTKLTGANRHSVWRHACLRVCEATEQLGVEVGPILKDVGLGLAGLMTPGFRVPLDAYQRLVMACVLETGRFDLGFYINQNITVLGNTLVQNALISSSSAKRAFDRYIDLAHIVDTPQSFGYETNGNASAPIIGKPDAVWSVHSADIEVATTRCKAHEGLQLHRHHVRGKSLVQHRSLLFQKRGSSRLALGCGDLAVPAPLQGLFANGLAEIVTHRLPRSQLDVCPSPGSD